MPKPKPVATMSSDNHLQDRAWASRPTLTDDAYYAFTFQVEYAIANKIPYIILAGDVLDKQKNEARLVAFVREQMQRCQDASVQVRYITGQHERQDGIPWLSAIHHWPQHLEATSDLEAIGPFRAYGIDWTPLDQLQEALDAVPAQTDLLVLHQVCSEYMGSVTVAELSWDRVPHAWMLLIGDYHGAHETIERTNFQGRKMRVFCPGSQAMQAIDEPPVKQFFVLYDDASVRSVQIPGRRFLQPPDLLTEANVDTVIESAMTAVRQARGKAEEQGLWPELQTPILYVRFNFDIPDAYRRIAAAVGDEAHLFYKELRPKPADQDVVVEQRRERLAGGLVGALPQVVPDTDSAVYHISRRLLESRNLPETMAAIRAEYLEGVATEHETETA